jgi:hypothetical protein
MKRIALVSMLGLACVSMGVQVRPDQIKDFEKGKTTYGDVVQRLGPPTTNMMASDGTRTAMYTYTRSQARASSFIPVVGLFAGGADTQMTQVAFRFDTAGRLLDYTSSESNLGAGTNLAAGAPQAMPSSAQPLRAEGPEKPKAENAALPGCSSSIDCDKGAICFEGSCRR